MRYEGEKWCDYELQVISSFFNFEGTGTQSNTAAFPKCLTHTLFFSDKGSDVCFQTVIAGKRKSEKKGITEIRMTLLTCALAFRRQR